MNASKQSEQSLILRGKLTGCAAAADDIDEEDEGVIEMRNALMFLLTNPVEIQSPNGWRVTTLVRAFQVQSNGTFRIELDNQAFAGTTA